MQLAWGQSCDFSFEPIFCLRLSSSWQAGFLRRLRRGPTAVLRLRQGKPAGGEGDLRRSAAVRHRSAGCQGLQGFRAGVGGDKRKIARGLIADRNACRSDTACIVSALNNALQTYGNAPSWVQDYNIALIGKKALDVAARNPGNRDQSLPSAVGQCATTHIKTLTTRLGDDPLETAPPEGGSAATFTNGGGSVSYDREPGLAASKVGEPVEMCLIAIPRDCPRTTTVAGSTIRWILLPRGAGPCRTPSICAAAPDWPCFVFHEGSPKLHRSGLPLAPDRL